MRMSKKIILILLLAFVIGTSFASDNAEPHNFLAEHLKKQKADDDGYRIWLGLAALYNTIYLAKMAYLFANYLKKPVSLQKSSFDWYADQDLDYLFLIMPQGLLSNAKHQVLGRTRGKLYNYWFASYFFAVMATFTKDSYSFYKWLRPSEDELVAQALQYEQNIARLERLLADEAVHCFKYSYDTTIVSRCKEVFTDYTNFFGAAALANLKNSVN